MLIQHWQPCEEWKLHNEISKMRALGLTFLPMVLFDSCLEMSIKVLLASYHVCWRKLAGVLATLWDNQNRILNAWGRFSNTGGEISGSKRIAVCKFHNPHATFLFSRRKVSPSPPQATGSWTRVLEVIWVTGQWYSISTRTDPFQPTSLRKVFAECSWKLSLQH